MLQPLTGGLTPLGVGRHTGSYASKLLAAAPANLLAYWKFDELSGTTAYDSSGNGLHGSYNGPTLGGATFADGSSAPDFDGTNDYVSMFSSGLQAGWDSNEYTALAWIKTSEWANPGWRFAVSLRYSGSIAVAQILKNTSANSLMVSFPNVNVAETYTDSAWTVVAITRSATSNIQRGYINGVQFYSAAAAVVSDPLIMAAIGKYSAADTYWWKGAIAHVALWDTALSAAQVVNLATV